MCATGWRIISQYPGASDTDAAAPSLPAGCDLSSIDRIHRAARHYHAANSSPAACDALDPHVKWSIAQTRIRAADKDKTFKERRDKLFSSRYRRISGSTQISARKRMEPR